jgi:CheY-like chemotaxis protein
MENEKRILIVHPSVKVCSSIVMTAKTLGLKPDHAQSNQSALNMSLFRQYHLIILDLSIHDLDPEIFLNIITQKYPKTLYALIVDPDMQQELLVDQPFFLNVILQARKPLLSFLPIEKLLRNISELKGLNQKETEAMLHHIELMERSFINAQSNSYTNY